MFQTDKVNVIEDFEYEGVKCLVLGAKFKVEPNEEPKLNHYLGYVQVNQLIPDDKKWEDIIRDIHGGITFDDEFKGLKGYPGRWIGFDCSHSSDHTMAMTCHSHPRCIKWTPEMVKEEVIKMAVKVSLIKQHGFDKFLMMEAI